MRIPVFFIFPVPVMLSRPFYRPRIPYQGDHSSSADSGSRAVCSAGTTAISCGV